MSIYGIVGDIGSGKSWTQLKQGLLTAEKKKKQIVANFAINRHALKEFASQPSYGFLWGNLLAVILVNLLLVLRWWLDVVLAVCFPKFFTYPNDASDIEFVQMPIKYPWLNYLTENGGIIQIYAPEILQALMIPESVVLLDEAGVFLNSRQFQKLSMKFLNDLAQSRKQGTDIVWAAQFDEQVDKQFRMLTQFFIHCSSLSRYAAHIGRPIMYVKNVFWFTASSYFDWIKDPRNKIRPLRTRFGFASKTESGTLTKEDKMIFNIFSSFDRLDTDSFVVSYLQQRRDQHKPLSIDIVTLWKCDLSPTYYKRKLYPNYLPDLDPLSDLYNPRLFDDYDFLESSKGLEVVSSKRLHKFVNNKKSVRSVRSMK
ncbi:zonular occludens toxin domain-containing protein [Spirulina sp. 06S082]|uniref:zonular occludens toxin domain-containing protein n=1 Tax=Spirulina sp. 06S082 TaxID=3110248 RepID=UPI002B215676|nr:zonular occludens toxin domain-containing protein [Spirulina sp. 06S082]MEA5472156.1 zonular occludens toxin domain-containing protein [Spirulina sp. 06S082]